MEGEDAPIKLHQDESDMGFVPNALAHLSKPGLTGLLAQLPWGCDGGLQIHRSSGPHSYPEFNSVAALDLQLAVEMEAPTMAAWRAFPVPLAKRLLFDIRDAVRSDTYAKACDAAATHLWPQPTRQYQRWYIKSEGGVWATATLCKGGLYHGGVRCRGPSECVPLYTSHAAVLASQGLFMSTGTEDVWWSPATIRRL